MTEDYYLRDLTRDDWSKFHEMDLDIFPDEPLQETSFFEGLSSIKTQSVIMIEKETKDFIGYYRIGIYGNLGHIYRIGVHSNYRGKGYGSKLLEKAIFYLEKAGCTKLFLYVREDNKEAINLYKKFSFEDETKSWQYIIPYNKLLENPRGKVRHVDWGEIQLISLRFRQNPFQIQQYFSRENQHVLVYEIMGQQIGFCRFSPDFPGAMPFIINDPNYAFDFVSFLKEFITNPSFDSIRITFDGQSRLVEKFNADGMKLNYSLIRMSKTSDV